VTTKEKPTYGKRSTKRSNKFTRPRKFQAVDGLFGSGAGDLANCDVQITPDCVAALYEIPPSNPTVSPNNSLGIFEEGDYYAQEDLNLFFRNLSSNIPQGTHPIPAFIDGAEAPVKVSEAGGESDLDFELAFPIIYPQTITLFQTDDSNYASDDTPTAGFFNTFLDALDGVRTHSFL
jgi:tripeptidyl-peptidase I